LNVLITGGAGFIGSHLVDRCIDLDFKVTVVDDLSSGCQSNLNHRAEFILGDVTDSKLMLRVTKNVDVIFHMAAMSRSGPSINQPEMCFEKNVKGSHTLLLAAVKNNVQKFIYSASSTCYGNQPIPHKLDSNIELLNFYSLSKFHGEQEALLFSKFSNLQVISLRYFNVYGPRQPLSGNYALVTGIFLQAKSSNLPVEIHGNGLQTRDFVYIDDVVAANLCAMNSRINGKYFNIGSGKNYSVLEIANILDLRYTFTPRRQGDADHTLADISSSKMDLGWVPKVALREGLMSTLSVQK
jgi:UDP-glucose 4-epimerase